jgi:hypothetical protein
MFRILFFSLSMLLAHTMFARAQRTAGPPEEAPTVSHAIWDKLLKSHVNKDGFVDYKGFIRDSTKFNEYLGILSAANPKADNWSREEQMAFWINAYNAFTVKLIIDNYPVKSIKDIKKGIAFVNSVWDIQFIKIGGDTYDLNNIEHKILRSKFKDARIHAAINCASYSCPVLRDEAYTAEKLDKQLTDAMRKFVNDPSRNKVSAKKAEISEIFKWFRKDFTRDAGSIRGFLNKYADKKLDANGNISYLDYNWNLNESK